MNKKNARNEAQLLDFFLFYQKLMFESKTINFQTTILEKEEKLKAISGKLENTPK